ncbi:hypothetical protein ISN44_As13g023760 [Arabidopsis suecica]|uniref:KIB1-4 beta-propeller domain-containing protein n=1 Tax=Arabidopsis suecica TaxID=45249 RepID=A0A8T1Y0J8_ARASU|nr:hypothetical protein ISN44_As13g023760 [Arabidopsis suecica]
MSLLLSQPSTLCFRKPVFVRSSPIHSNNVFSSTSLPQTPPCVIMYVDPCGADPGKLVIRGAGDSTPLEKKLPMELTNEMRPIGSSNGWLTTLKDGVMGLQDIDLNLVASDVDPKRISLPPLVTLPHCQTQIVTNVAMSSSSPEDEDCVVAVKFLGPQLSFFRPAQSNSEWINIRVKNPCFFSSPVMYSKKDDMFRIPGSGGHLIASWDLHKHGEKTKFQRLQFRKIPNMTKDNKRLLDSCCKSEHLVESRTTGETFMVKLYKKTPETWDGIAKKMQTVALMVFKLDDKGSLVYTQDIGDLSIFLTKSEPFCVPSSSFPDMYPNHVNVLDVDETAIVNLAEQKWNC